MEKKELLFNRGRFITFSRSMTIPLTYTCHNRCSYCGFREEGDKIRPLDEIIEILRQAKNSSCREILLMSGEQPWLEPNFPLPEPEFINYVYHVCLTALRWGLLPHTNIGLLGFHQLQKLKEVNVSMGLMLETNNQDLTCHAIPPG